MQPHPITDSDSLDFAFVGAQDKGEIKMSCEHQSPHYTTLWSDLPKTSVR